MVTIKSVENGSPAAKHGIQPGDNLISIDQHPIQDVLDYRFFLTESKITLLLQRNGTSYEVVLKKGRYDDIGLDFETFLMDQKRRCANRCIFCFIDQNPPGMRETVYFKDDDTRLSFLMGNYVTLTNVKDQELERIVKMKLNPVNVSVHTTNPQLRITMLGNPKADRIMDQLRILKEGGIDLNCQIVACRGYNDGPELERTLNDLKLLFPSIRSIAVVPVGLTDYRDGLPKILPYDRESAREVLDIVDRYAHRFFEKYGSAIVFAADEFYLAAQRELPDGTRYEDYPQLDNGVGLLRNDQDEISDELDYRYEEGTWKDLPQIPLHITVATGVAAEQFMRGICNKISEKLPFLHFTVLAVKNRFFGETVTVAGLICGEDIINAVKDQKPEILFIPAVALRHERDLFLDNVPFSRLPAELGCQVVAVENGTDLLDQIENLLKERSLCQNP